MPAAATVPVGRGAGRAGLLPPRSARGIRGEGQRSAGALETLLPSLSPARECPQPSGASEAR